ncbi:uncharacterized protein LOC144074316 isoform X2 [Stigmatopora argus]
MEFPVDFLADVSQAQLEASAHKYMNHLLYSNTNGLEEITLSDYTKVSVGISSVGYVPLYVSSDKDRTLALFSPSNPFNAVALYLLDKWWTADDILKTSNVTRNGTLKVESVGERIVLYVLNRLIYRVREINPQDELPFLCHGGTDYSKICWRNGEAVGFYSVKHSGTLYSYSSRRYQLPVMDSIFVRKCHRRNGFGLHMLEDFVLSFQDDCLGLRYPLTRAMYKMCEKYLHQYPGDADLLWEVEGEGGLNQRFNIASKIHAMKLRETPAELSEEPEKEVSIVGQIKAAESLVYTVEIVDEVLVGGATGDTREMAVTTRSRSSARKQGKKADEIVRSQSKKVSRLKDIEAQNPQENILEEEKATSCSDLVVTKGTINMLAEEKGKNEVADLTEIKIIPQDEDVTALGAEVRQATEILTQSCSDSHIGIEEPSEMEGIEQVPPEEAKSIEELDLTIDENLEEKAGFPSEVSDNGQVGSTLLPLNDKSHDDLKPAKVVHEEGGKRTAEELRSVEGDGAPSTGQDEVRPFIEGSLEDENAKVMELENKNTDEYQILPAGTEASQEEDADLPKLQEARVILVDLKTANHAISEKEAEQTATTEGSAELLVEGTELEAKVENNMAICVEETTGMIFTTTETETAKIKDENSEKEIVDEMEGVPVEEMRVLRRGRRKVGPSCRSTSKTEKQAGARCLPINNLHEADSITMEEEAVVVKDTEEEKQLATSEVSVNLKKEIEMVTTTETIVISDDELQAKKPVLSLGQETEPTAAHEQSEEIASKLPDLKTIPVIVVEDGVPENFLPENGGDLEETTGEENTAEKHVFESEIEQKKCTKEAEGAKKHELIQDEEKTCDVESSLEEMAVDVQTQSIELKTSSEKESTIAEDCPMEQEELRQEPMEEDQATEREVAAGIPDEGSTLKDPTQESMKTQASVEKYEETPSVLASVPSGDIAQEIQLQEFATTVDQNPEVKRVDLGTPGEERFLRKGRKWSAPATTGSKSKRARGLQQSDDVNPKETAGGVSQKVRKNKMRK